MGQVVALDALFNDRRIWRGQAVAAPPSAQPSGHAALDAALPSGGWPEAALTELLLPADGIGELRLLLPTLARLTQAGQDIVLVAPPYLPYPAGWRQAGVDFGRVHLVEASPRDALWATEQCLRGGCVAAVLAWPQRADDRGLRRLQVAAETGQTLGFAFRDQREACNPSPAALRIAVDGAPAQLRVLKCRGGLAPAQPIAFPHPGPIPRSLPRPHHVPHPRLPAGSTPAAVSVSVSQSQSQSASVSMASASMSAVPMSALATSALQ